MANPYQMFFSKLDQTVLDLEEYVKDHEADAPAVPTLKDAADLLRRAGFFLVNHLNTNVALLEHLIIPEPAAEEPAEDAEPTSQEETEPPQEG